MIDDRQLAKQFAPGDVVRVVGDTGTFLCPFPGRVIYSNTETGDVRVQWPWGDEASPASHLVKDMSGDLIPPTIDTSYNTYEKMKYSSILKKYEEKTFPLYAAACKNMFNGMGEIKSFLHLIKTSGRIFGQDEIRRTVSNLHKMAIYRKDNQRRYKITKQEKASGDLKCPRCREALKKRVYRAQRHVFLCRSCGFTISPKDLCE